MKIKLPPEIALQDFPDELTPQPSPSPPRYTFERTQPFAQAHALGAVHVPPKEEPMDLRGLGISEKSVAPPTDFSTMDWTPSQKETSFSPPRNTSYSRESSVFAAGRGILPPAPGTSFATPTKPTKPVNWFKTGSNSPFAVSKNEPNDNDLRRHHEEIQLREQRLFAPQVLHCLGKS